MAIILTGGEVKGGNLVEARRLDQYLGLVDVKEAAEREEAAPLHEWAGEEVVERRLIDVRPPVPVVGMQVEAIDERQEGVAFEQLPVGAVGAAEQAQLEAAQPARREDRADA